MKGFFFFTCLICLLSVKSSFGQFSAYINVTNPTCVDSSGSATVIASGGSNYTYKWSTGDTASTITRLSAGIYKVTVYSDRQIFPLLSNIYSEGFDSVNNWTLNVPTGTNDPYHNFWRISDTCGGFETGKSICGTDADVYTSNGNRTLYITNNVPESLWALHGANYDAGDGNNGCSLVYYGLYCTTTNMAAESPNINTTGANNLILRYDFLGRGAPPNDHGSSAYSVDGGNTYMTLDSFMQSYSNHCNSSGLWTNRKYYLPQTCNNLTNFKLRFNWINNDDGAGYDPTVAVNNIVLGDSIGPVQAIPEELSLSVTLVKSIPTARFVLYPDTSTLGLYYGYNYSYGNITSYRWDFGDGTTSTDKYPTHLYTVAGQYTVCLTVFDNTGCTNTYCDSTFYVYKKEGGLMSQLNIKDPNATGINPISASGIDGPTFSLFPNPSADEIALAVTGFQPEWITVYDVNGKKVSQQKYAPQINVQALSAGVYFVEVKGGEMTARRRMVKM